MSSPLESQAESTEARGTASPNQSGRPAVIAMLSEALRETFRTSIRATEVRELNQAETDHALGVAFARARGNDLPVEHLLVCLKEAWAELPEAQKLPPDVRTESLSRIVTACIHAYFSDDVTSHRRAD